MDAGQHRLPRPVSTLHLHRLPFEPIHLNRFAFFERKPLVWRRDTICIIVSRFRLSRLR
jgi:hypothetical protein